MGWHLAWAADWHLSIDRQPPSMLGKQKRQMWGAVMWRRKPACDWYGCHHERSEPCLKNTELSILLPFKQTKGHLCCYTLWLLPASPKQLLTSAQACSLIARLWSFPVFITIFALSPRATQEWEPIFGINAFRLSPFASPLLFNRVLLRVAGALLNSIPLLLRQKFGGSH